MKGFLSSPVVTTIIPQMREQVLLNCLVDNSFNHQKNCWLKLDPSGKKEEKKEKEEESQLQTLEDVMLSRVGIHLLSVCLSTGFENPFSQLFLNPEIYVDGYIVTMPPDLAAVVQKLLGASCFMVMWTSILYWSV